MASWSSSHITDPQMAYDSPLHGDRLTFLRLDAADPLEIWMNGAELVILEAPHLWGPLPCVAHESGFGPSNGSGAGFPIKWISRNGRDLWLQRAANFSGCGAHLNCSGAYGLNCRRVRPGGRGRAL